MPADPTSMVRCLPTAAIPGAAPGTVRARQVDALVRPQPGSILLDQAPLWPRSPLKGRHDSLQLPNDAGRVGLRRIGLFERAHIKPKRSRWHPPGTVPVLTLHFNDAIPQRLVETSELAPNDLALVSGPQSGNPLNQWSIDHRFTWLRFGFREAKRPDRNLM